MKKYNDTAIIWVNYNSSRIIDVVLRSLESISNLDYENYVLFVIDNGSTDNSINKIKKFIDSDRVLRYRTKVVTLEHNLGFTGAHNLIWKFIKMMYPNIKYLSLINNDTIVHEDSLSKLIEFLDIIPHTCGVQGIIEFRNTGLIDNFGLYLDELLFTYPFKRFKRIYDIPLKCYAVTYTSGAYTVYKVDVLKRIELKGGDMFPTQAFAYFDDDLIGIMAYLHNYRMVAIPIRVAKHFGSLTFKTAKTGDYFSLRSVIAKSSLVGTRYKPIAVLHALKSVFRKSRLSVMKDYNLSKIIIRDVVDGLLLAKKLKKYYGLRISSGFIEKIPLIHVNIRDALIALITNKFVLQSSSDFIDHILTTKYGFKCV